MVGADLANLVNEAALLAARRSHAKVEMADFTDAVEKIVLGVERARDDDAGRPRRAPPTTSPATRSSGCSRPGADPVRKVSIIPRGMSLGVTFSSPDADRYNYDEAYLKGAPAGRAGRPRRRGARLRHHHLGCGVRPPAGHGDRAPDGRALGHEPGDRAGRGAPLRGQRPAAARRLRDVGADAADDRRRGAAARRRGARGRAPSCLRASARAWTRSRARCSRPRRWTRRPPMPPPACRTPRRHADDPRASRLSPRASLRQR